MVCHTMFVDMQKLIKSTWKIMTKINNNSIFNIWGVNNLNGCAMLQKLQVNNFEWIEETSQFNKDFIKKL